NQGGSQKLIFGEGTKLTVSLCKLLP
uniref:Uncharacterized protein n=2 Tax=Rattus norvegicus TaxID=10116 RepID=A0ABK0M0W2_RAT